MSPVKQARGTICAQDRRRVWSARWIAGRYSATVMGWTDRPGCICLYQRRPTVDPLAIPRYPSHDRYLGMVPPCSSHLVGVYYLLTFWFLCVSGPLSSLSAFPSVWSCLIHPYYLDNQPTLHRRQSPGPWTRNGPTRHAAELRNPLIIWATNRDTSVGVLRGC